MVVKFDGARAVVVEDDQTRQIRIDIEGDTDAKRDLLAIIRKQFEDIYHEFNRKIEYEERIPCNCQQCRDRIEEENEPHYFDWQFVQRCARKPRDTIPCEVSLADVRVPMLVGEIAETPDPLDQFGSVDRHRPSEPERPAKSTLNMTVPPLWQIVTASVIGVGFLLLLLLIAFLVPEPTAFQLIVFRVILALGAAGFGALLPGFLEVDYRGWLRAGGAAAFFAVVYLVNPPGLIHDTPANSESRSRPATMNARKLAAAEQRMLGRVLKLDPKTECSTDDHETNARLTNKTESNMSICFQKPLGTPT